MFELAFYQILCCEIYRLSSFIQSVNGEKNFANKIENSMHSICNINVKFLSSCFYFTVLDLSPYTIDHFLHAIEYLFLQKRLKYLNSKKNNIRIKEKKREEENNNPISYSGF